MRAIRLFGMHDLRLEDVPKPAPGAGMVAARTVTVVPEILRTLCMAQARDSIASPAPPGMGRATVVTS